MINHRISTTILLFLTFLAASAEPESPADARRRHEHVAKRRTEVHLICHRGASEFAHENTLEAYRAAFELGADGNEIDVRATKDGVLVCFHDDMIDHLLEGYGDVSDLAWADLERLPFRNPGRFGKHCRIPTLREVLKLHRDRRGLIFLDVKRPGLEKAIGALLDELDMWDHVIQAPAEFKDPRIHRTRHKAGMYLDRSEVDDDAVAAALKAPGERILLESPQFVAAALGRKVGTPSSLPVIDAPAAWASRPLREPDDRPIDELLKVLKDDDDWNVVAREGPEATASASRILKRARAADETARRGVRDPEVFDSLERRVRRRSLHRDWRYCGLDACAALRALVTLKAPQAVDLARFCLWRDDPDVEAARNPAYANPRSWTDFRTKLPVFKMLESIPGAATERLCRDYLALSDEHAQRVGIPQFEDAARCLLAVSPRPETIRALEKHRLDLVRRRARMTALNIRE